MLEDVPCDICQQSHDEAVRPAERDQSYSDATRPTRSAIIEEARRREYSELARFCEDLVVVRGSCLLCRATGERWDHDFKSCYRRADVFHERKQARIRHESKGRKWLQPYTACFWCLNPQSICHRASGEANEQDNRCREPDVVLPLCYGIFLHATGADWLSERFDRQFRDIESFFDWLGEECDFGGGRAIQAVRVAAEALIDFGLY